VDYQLGTVAASLTVPGSVTDAIVPDENAPLILVVDDVPANVELLQVQLHTLGFRTVAAQDGPSALQACLQHMPDVCILDVSMPAGNLGVEDRATGFEVCRRIKRDPRTARIPVIFVTALNETSDRVRAIEAGGDDFLTKPHNRLILGARVRSLLRLKLAMDALEGSLRKLRELEKLKDDLMKMIVHDLKSPLSAVLATLEMLRDGDFGELGEAQANAVTDAESRAHDLLDLISDLLELARLEEAELSLELQEMNAAGLVDELVSEWDMRLRQSGSTLAVEIASRLPAFRADPSLLKRVFSNLLQNALVHGGGPVRVRITAREEAGFVLFSVQDDGPGIAPEYLELIFRKFETLGSAPSLLSPQMRNSGLGLAFCKLAVEAHRGRIWAASRLGEGSTFYVQLPCDPESAPARA
jgi:two-component system sensor histidine kinase/response regulator